MTRICPECKKAFEKSQSLYQHLQDKHQVAICHQCEKRCFDKQGIENHWKAVHSRKKLPNKQKKVKKTKKILKALGLNSKKKLTTFNNQETQNTTNAYDSTKEEALSEEERVKKVREYRETFLER